MLIYENLIVVWYIVWKQINLNFFQINVVFISNLFLNSKYFFYPFFIFLCVFLSWLKCWSIPNQIVCGQQWTNKTRDQKKKNRISIPEIQILQWLIANDKCANRCGDWALGPNWLPPPLFEMPFRISRWRRGTRDWVQEEKELNQKRSFAMMMSKQWGRGR